MRQGGGDGMFLEATRCDVGCDRMMQLRYGKPVTRISSRDGCTFAEATGNSLWKSN
ncbi:hypothetical protein [Scytonema sp. PCC 10023]|uniref:hypothetical protein n=1 Tax=Scytonema sp. PCC 10023 TaxID=1680591 RepID=UPI0039C6E204